MTTFQIISVCVGLLVPIGLIISVSVRTQICLAKMQLEITNFRRDLDQKEIALTKMERDNREDHQILNKKLDTLLLKTG